jgi:hypothetical protein
MKRAVLTVIAIAAFAVPAPALAAPILAAPLPSAKSAQSGSGADTTPLKLTLNELSNRRALNAYATYLTTLITQESVGQSNDTSYITTVSEPGTGGCKAALAPLTEPPDEVDAKAQHTLTVLGEEIGDDVTITFDLSATQPFTRFSSVLKAQRWTRLSDAMLVIKRYVNTETNMLSLAASNLCLDASDAELHPDVVPSGTKAFLPLYDQTSKLANAALTNLMTLMQTYEIPSEKALIARIATLANELSTQSKADLLQSGMDLSTVLESN